MPFYEWDEERLGVVRSSIQRFCKENLSPEYVRWMDENCDFPPEDLWKKLADYGVFDRSLAGSPYESLIIQEEIATASTAVGLAIGAAISFGQLFIEMLGTEEQRQEFLPKLALGELKMCMALTEPGGGTDILGSLRTTAVRDGDEYVLNGQKVFITAAHVADYIIAVAITDPHAEDRTRAWSIFLVDARSPGITIRKIPKLGVHACAATEIFFEQVRVPAANMLGPENCAYGVLVGGRGGPKGVAGTAAKMSLLNLERVGTSMLSLGIAKAAYRDALAYASERIAFGRPIGQYQLIQSYLVEMAMQIENARNLLYSVISRELAGKSAVKQVQMAKIMAGRASEYCAIKGMEILGGWGYTMEYDMQRYFRDYKQMVFAPITEEMAINVLAQMLGLPKSY